MFAVCVFMGTVFAAVSPAFLIVNPDAKTAAMGNAYAALADSNNSVIFNPAGLFSIKNTEVFFSHFISFADTNYDYVSFLLPLDHGKATAFSLFCHYTTSFKEYNELGDIVGNIDYYEIEGIASYSQNILNSISAGGNLKVFTSRLSAYSKNGICVDAGIKIKIATSPDAYIGLVLQNLGTQSAYIETVDNLPANLKAGIGFKFPLNNNVKTTLQIDVNKLLLETGQISMGAGLEFAINNTLYPRLGCIFENGNNNITGGVGFVWETIEVSYAIVPYDALGLTHRLSLAWKF